jgi:hypothetical protein
MSLTPANAPKRALCFPFFLSLYPYISIVVLLYNELNPATPFFFPSRNHLCLEPPVPNFCSSHLQLHSILRPNVRPTTTIADLIVESREATAAQWVR